MLKRVVLASLLVAGLATGAVAEDRGTSSLKVGGKSVTVEYGRPSLAGRDMLAKAPIGNEWRLGAGSPTALKTEADLSFGAKAVAKGDYILRARRDAEDKWTLLVKKADAVVAEVPLTLSALADGVETLTIDLSAASGGGDLKISWGKSALSTRFSAK